WTNGRWSKARTPRTENQYAIVAAEKGMLADPKDLDINSIPNLRILLAKEGFEHVKLSYLGGLWVLIELDNEGSKQKFLDHVGVNSWFCTLLNAYNDFVSDERVVWVDIEGIPLHVWSRETFAKIGNKWGEALDIEDNFGSSFARKRLCILTKQPESILEKFKVIFKGKVFVARAKELFTWNPSFLEPKESVYTSDDESKHGAKILNDGAQNSDVESDDECNVDGVSETIFSDNVDECNVDGHGKETDKHQSEDPFGFYDLLNKLPAKGVRDASTSLSHPPGFTPKTSVTHANVGEICEDGPTNGEDMVNMPRVDAKVMDHSQEVHDSSNGESVSSFSHKVHNGGSILDILDDMVRVGHSMGYNLDGCLGHKTKKEWVKELNCKHRINFLALQETKMDCISHMDVKSLWGNSNFDFVASDSLGNSGGILCIWEASIFKKDGATISDNFIAIYGTWLPRNVKILLVAVYAPQQPGSKRALWDFLSNLVRRWNGEAIIMGDFNDVRTMDERLGSSFNVSSARCFDRFIVSSGLVDVKLEGYSFTWSHPSASKMSKLDRFLVTEGWRFLIQMAGGLRELSFSHSDSYAIVRLQEEIARVVNYKFFHGIIDRRRSQLSFRGVFVEEPLGVLIRVYEMDIGRSIAGTNIVGLFGSVARIVSVSPQMVYTDGHFLVVQFQGLFADLELDKVVLSSSKDKVDFVCDLSDDGVVQGFFFGELSRDRFTTRVNL
ncbi:RNA-directed DNA polymerase, eukaryota, partial [Tanacetum coccineum]